jgi:glutathione S-transferase
MLLSSSIYAMGYLLLADTNSFSQMRLWVFDHFKGGLGIPEEGKGGEDEQVWARWRKWIAAVQNRKSVKETMSDKEHYIPIYQSYADDTAQSEMAKAIRQGRGVP